MQECFILHAAIECAYSTCSYRVCLLVNRSICLKPALFSQVRPFNWPSKSMYSMDFEKWKVSYCNISMNQYSVSQNYLPYNLQDIYGKYSKILNTFLVLFSNKMLVIRAGIHKMLVRKANREDTSSLTWVCPVCLGFCGRQQLFEILEHIP